MVNLQALFTPVEASDKEILSLPIFSYFALRAYMGCSPKLFIQGLSKGSPFARMVLS